MNFIFYFLVNEQKIRPTSELQERMVQRTGGIDRNGSGIERTKGDILVESEAQGVEDNGQTHGFKPAEGDKESTTNESAIDEGKNDGVTRGKSREKRRRSLEGCQQDDGGNNIRWWRTGDETTEGSSGQVRGSDLTECQHG